ncbi:metallophosphoesterase [Clostridiaceae bacterium 68-1-5]|uniref:Phosphoesterase n=1 Tax=Suipraeoptans intestinalis TaxID=2606628 RepID=A0A6N7V077_9FIRM|nr:metallophosphoesterase [Suipraeoptans intestinalis]MSR93540.1 metallophosphoesterase [Suipraeoptans intestinalis]
MKLLIISDTHGSHINVDKVLEKEEGMDLLIHLGDVEKGEDAIRYSVNCPAHFVRGNNDFFSDLPREKELFLEGWHLFLCHGHAYYVSVGEEQLKREARGRGADIVLYGHTHRPVIHREENLLILNPGSLTHPRQEGRRPSYMILVLEEGKEPEAWIKYL